MGDSRAFQAPNGAQLRLVQMAPQLPPQPVRPADGSAAAASGGSVIRMAGGQQFTVGPNIMLRHPGMPQYVFVHGNAGPQIIARPAGPIHQPQQPIQQRPPVSHVTVSGVASTGIPVASNVNLGSNESIAKCSNFLNVLQRLSRENCEDESRPQRVSQLIRDVVEERLPVPEFVDQLKEALGSSTNSEQLLGFLNNHLPNYRRAYRQGLVRIDSVQQQQPTLAVHRPAQLTQPAPVQIQKQPTALPMVRTLLPPSVITSPAVSATTIVSANSSAPTTIASATPTSAPASGQASLQREDDFNDVKALGGVNIRSEKDTASSASSSLAASAASVPASAVASVSSAVTSAVRQCPEQGVLFGSGSLRRRLLNIARTAGLVDLSDSAVAFVSAAVERRLTGILERAAAAAEHRAEPLAAACPYLARTDDPSRRLKFLAGLDAQEKQRKDEEERERLLRAAKSRAKLDDPEQQKLKQKAKELQEAEYEQDKQDKANETAALAIFGSSRKRPFFGAGGSGSVSGGSAGGIGGSGGVGGVGSGLTAKRPKLTRIGLRDLLMALQSDSKAPKRLLYKAAS